MNADGHLKTLGRYRIERVLGRGAMGLVYEGVDPRLDRPVAIKTILKSHLLDEALAGEYSARFVREAQAAGRLSHPNIVSVFDFGEQDDVAYLVMEFIRGRELAAHFEDDDFFDLPQAVRIMGELLDALGYAHERGIVHRDVKPANVMIETGSLRVKLTDFGVARLADANTDRTQPGTMVGTPSYMSPEQIQGLAVGSRTDLFAAGVVLYQFITHQKPFTGGGQWTVQRKIIQDDPVPPSLANRALPPVFDSIVRRALAKDPADRYATAAEFAADLRAALACTPAAPVGRRGAPADVEADADATVIRPRAPASIAKLSPSPSLPQAPRDAPTRQQRPALRTAGVLLLAALLGGFAWRVLSPDPGPAPSATGPASVGGPPPEATAAPALPPPAPTATPAPTPEAAILRPQPRPATARAPAGANLRCSDLLQRVQLGETLSPEDQQVLQRECRR